MKVDLTKPAAKPIGWEEMSIREKILEIQCLVTSLNILFREVREQIEKNDSDTNKTNIN